MANQLTRYATVATVDTAGEGFFFGGIVYAKGSNISSAFNSGANVVVTDQFVLPFRATVRKIVFEVTTLSVGAFASVGLYSADGNTLLVHTGAVSTTTTGNKSTTLGTPVTLEPGIYVLARTYSDGTIVCRGFTTSGTTRGFLNQNANRVGDAANASSSGVLPATLGAITPGADNLIVALFEP